MPHSYALGSLSRLILKLNLAFYWDFVAPKIPALTRKQEMKEKMLFQSTEASRSVFYQTTILIVKTNILNKKFCIAEAKIAANTRECDQSAAVVLPVAAGIQ